MKSKLYSMVLKFLATGAITANGLHQSMVNPGPQDAVNAIIWALVIFAIWDNTIFGEDK